MSQENLPLRKLRKFLGSILLEIILGFSCAKALFHVTKYDLNATADFLNKKIFPMSSESIIINVSNH